MKKLLILLLIPFVISAKSKKEVRSGNHDLTLQWIESKKPGKIFFQKTGQNSFSVEGEHKSTSNDDYLSITGTIEVLSPTELEFNGKITSKVYHIYEGKPCVREGKQIFKAHGKRKYWRMKEKINCDGVVTDYVDIFF